MTQTNLITPKEINKMMMEFQSQQLKFISLKEDMYEYKDFDSLLFDVRFELAKSRIMDTNIDRL